jgi:hypothetical protein
MKKLIIAILLIFGSFSFVNAQTVKKTEKKKATTTASTVAPSVAAKSTKVEKTTAHVKKDGTADKRFKENKTKVASTAGPMKKNGTPDMRYKANKKK